jgi:hypothetical protein
MLSQFVLNNRTDVQKLFCEENGVETVNDCIAKIQGDNKLMFSMLYRL